MERKSATKKKNSNRPKASQRGLVQSLQRNYYQKKEKVELTLNLFN